MPTPPPAPLPTARSWAVAGSVAAGGSLLKKEEAVVVGLELFAAASAHADDGYARWKAEVETERAEQEATQRAAELPTTENVQGYVQWKADAEAARRAFERRWGIPLGKLVRVQLRGEPREREGLLLAVEETKRQPTKQLRLRLGTYVFSASQIESVVRV
jgi:hypothetical protein